MEIALTTLVVNDYDEALAFYVDAVGFELVEDSPSTANDGSAKRWVVIRPPGAATGLLVAEASTEDQRAVVGRQHGGRVGFFLQTEDFDAQYRRMRQAGVRFREEPRHEPYGTVVVWEDLYGNPWDLVQPATPTAEGPAAEGAAFPPPADVGEVLVSATDIARRVAELGAELTVDYADKNPLLVSVLKGSLVFVADLMRAVRAPLEIDFLAVSSYGAATRSSGVVKILKDLDQDIAGRHVLMVEDIVDSGLTLKFLLERFSTQRPASLKTCSMVVRDGVANQPEVDYVGFRLPPGFVVGYGLDAGQQYRHLPYIARYANTE
ncbi:MAG: hypoxanthine phosphoribosyltransferase [Actinomycetota bacterium]